MKKIIKIIGFNILFWLLLLLLAEVIIWAQENIMLSKHRDPNIQGMYPFHPGITKFSFDLRKYPYDPIKGKDPEGLKYKKKPIVLFGCSYAYGFSIEQKDSLQHKLSVLTKRPVYNRSYPGWGAQHMYYQVSKDEFYKLVPEPEYAIYVLMSDQFRRLYTINFASGEMMYENFNLRYKEKDGKLIQIRHVNPFTNFIKRLYLTNKIHSFYLRKVFLKKDEPYDFMVKILSKSREEMQKHWKKTKYVIVVYDRFYNDYKFTQKLEDNNFIVINLPNEVPVNLDKKEYNTDDYHPNAKAWNEIVPIIIKDLKL